MTLALRRDAEAALERGGAWGALFEDAAAFARGVAGTEFVPRALRNQPAAVAACVLFGAELGLGPMQSLARIHIIEGRPTLAAEAQRALVFAAGHELWLEELTATRATWCGRRALSDQVTRITFTMDDARRAKLDGKQNWRQYPRQMLSARASAELVRAVFADVVGGLAAVEEIEGEQQDVTGAGDAASTAAPPRARRSRNKAVVAAQQPAAPEVDAGEAVGVQSPPLDGGGGDRPPLPWELEREAGEVEAPAPAPLDSGSGGPGMESRPATADQPAPAMTDGQRRRMHAAFRAVGIEARPERLRYTSTLIGREVKSAKELTSSEADRVVDALEQERAEILTARELDAQPAELELEP